jgi:hypothetical protein
MEFPDHRELRLPRQHATAMQTPGDRVREGKIRYFGYARVVRGEGRNDCLGATDSQNDHYAARISVG